MAYGVYESFRKSGGPTLYPPLKTAVTADVLEAGFIFATVILAASLLLVLPGLHGKETLYSAIKIIVGIFITASIILCNFGQEWEVAHVKTLTQYRAGLPVEITASVGVKIGLRSVNITLKGDPHKVINLSETVNETVNYNERFSWDDLGFTQGRAGFGPYAGLFNRQYREGQFKGVPYPILWVAEYFTIDGEGIRWGRFYRQAGYYTHILLWLAFPMWLLSMILVHMVIRYGGYMSGATGMILLVANILYATIRNPLVLVIPFSDGNLTFSWGWCFWMNIFTGVLCLVIGVVIFIMDLRAYEAIATFFGVDVLQDYDEVYLDHEELDVVVAASNPKRTMKDIKKNSTNSDLDDYEDTELGRMSTQTVRQFRKRSTAFTRKLQKSRKNQLRTSVGGDIELTDTAKKYVNNDRTQSIPEGDEDVFDETYENTGFSNDQNRSFQYRSGSGPVDNNLETEEDQNTHSVHF